MKRILSMLLCAATMLACLCIAPASAVDTSVTLRVGLTISGASTFANPQLENVSGEPTGYAIGTMDGTDFKSDASVSASQLTITLSAWAVLSASPGKRVRMPGFCAMSVSRTVTRSLRTA